MMLTRIITTLILVALATTSSIAATWTGKVVKVVDGDTIHVLKNGRKMKIRLYGIDTPEGLQVFGEQAANQIKKFVSRKTVEVTTYDTDRYDRPVSVIKIGKFNVNRAMIESGFAWQYRKYCKKSFCDEWLQLEEEARNAGIGLWRDKNPLPPWEWRKSQRENNKSTDIGGKYHGNSKTHVLHSTRCKYFNCKNCTVPFENINEALKQGYRPHNQCMQ